MTMINQKMASLLDKLYNLRGDNSVILSQMDEEKNVTEEIRTKTSVNKSDLESKLDSLDHEEQKISTQGERLKQLLSAFSDTDYSEITSKLGVNFNPNEILNTVSINMPDVLSRISSEKESVREELYRVTEELNESITKLEEINIRRAEAISNQERLNRYFDLAINSNINITRDDITILLSKFGFDEQEQRTAAKILMFPEDDLFEYEQLRRENPNVENIADLLKESKTKEEESEEVVEEIVPEEEEVKEKPKSRRRKKKEETIEESDAEEMVEEEIPAAPIFDIKVPEEFKIEEEPVVNEEVSMNDESPVEEIAVETMEIPENDPIVDFTVPTVEPIKTKKEKEVEVETTEATQEVKEDTASLEPVLEEAKEEEIPEQPVDTTEEQIIEEPAIEKVEETLTEDTSNVLTEQVQEEPVIENMDTPSDVNAENNTLETTTEVPVEAALDTSIETAVEVAPEVPLEEIKEEPKEFTKEDLTVLLNSLGLDYLDYTNDEFNKLQENVDKELFEDNVKLVDALGMDKDLFKDHSELLYDKDLKNKITKLTEVGKLPNDIYLYPSILTKYNYEELQSAINVLIESGLEPKKVPLIAY